MDKANARVKKGYVAARAGVSATVSHVLNHVPGKRIRPDTRESVRLAAEDLGYVLNGVARSSGAASEQGAPRANFDLLSIIAVDAILRDLARRRTTSSTLATG